MFTVEMTKKTLSLFLPTSSMFPVHTDGMFGKCEPVNIKHLHGFRFERKKDAVKFAVWASAMATSTLERGHIATINLLFD